MEVEEILYDSKHHIDTAILRKSIKRIRRKGIRQLGDNFYVSLNLVNEMIRLPRQLLALLHLERSIVFYDTMARVKAGVLGMMSEHSEDDFQELYRKEFEKSMELKFIPQKDEIAKGAVEESKHMFIQMLEKNELGIRETYKAILYSSVVWIWCGFEVLMRELWKQ